MAEPEPELPGEASRLAIIVVNWNTSQLLDECLSSIRANAPRDAFEVIVVDNASADGSVSMVRQRHPDVRLVQNDRNLGFAAANNIGIAMAQSEYILLLNSDTRVISDVLQKSVDYMDGNPAVGAMGCRVLNTDGTLQVTSGGFPSIINLLLLTSGLARLPWPEFFDRYQLRRWQRRDERPVDVISGCYLLVRKSVIRKVGGLDEKFFFFGEETDWCRRIADAGYELRLAPVGEIIHHGGGSVKKLSYQRDLMLSSAMIKLHRKHFGLASALGVLMIIHVFHVSRGLIWGFRYLVDQKESSKVKFFHFLNLIRNSGKMWPADTTWKFQ